MGQLVLLVVAAAWAAVLVPRCSVPGSRTVRTRRSPTSATSCPACSGRCRRAGSPCGRWPARLAPSPLSRPAAARPSAAALRRSHPRWEHSGPQHRASRPSTASACTTPRHGPAATAGDTAAQPGPQPAAGLVGRSAARDAVKRRRANVLFVLVLVAACSLFLAATTKAEAMLYVFGVAFLALCGYVYVLGQLRQREQPPAEIVVRGRGAAPPHRQRHTEVRRSAAHRATVRRQTADRWSHAV